MTFIDREGSRAARGATTRAALHSHGHDPERDERLTVAPIVGPDDQRRFTDSGIEIKRALRREPTSRRT